MTVFSLRKEIIKVGGAELEGDSLQALVEYLIDADHKDERMLVFGGGPQIDAQWKKRHREERPKKDGIVVTSDEVLNDAVFPAYAELRQRLTNLLPALEVLPYDHVRCTKYAGGKFGLVGEVKSILLPDSRKLVGIGFVGVDASNTLQQYNINADSIIPSLVQQIADDAWRVLIVTETGGVLDDRSQRVPRLTTIDIESMIAGFHPSIHVRDGMLKKVMEVRRTLESLSSVRMLKATELQQHKNGEDVGTLCLT